MNSRGKYELWLIADNFAQRIFLRLRRALGGRAPRAAKISWRGAAFHVGAGAGRTLSAFARGFF
jgi:hypothetical protein